MRVITLGRSEKAVPLRKDEWKEKERLPAKKTSGLPGGSDGLFGLFLCPCGLCLANRRHQLLMNNLQAGI